MHRAFSSLGRWAPKPWTTKIVEQDLRSGGKSVIDMRDPDREGGAAGRVYVEDAAATQRALKAGSPSYREGAET